MKTISAALQAHMNGDLTTITKLFWLQTKLGVIYSFTSLDRDVTYLGVTYKSIASVGFTQIARTADMSVDNVQITGMLENIAGLGNFTSLDITSGALDYAQINVYYVNWADLTQGHVWVLRGTLGEVDIMDGQYQAEIMGLTQALQQTLGRVTCQSCSWAFGGVECGVNVPALMQPGVVSSVANVTTFQTTSAGILAQPVNWATRGYLTWTGGANIGSKMDIRAHAPNSNTLELWLPPAGAIAVGDTFNLYPGCDLQYSSCRDKWNNYLNFGGMKDVPGPDLLTIYG